MRESNGGLFQTINKMKTSFAKAIQMWEEELKKNASEEEEIKLNFTNPPIDKMDPAILSTLTKCKHLALSTNCIEKWFRSRASKNCGFSRSAEI